METAAQSDSGSETEDESELTSSLESPMSGSINYFVASLDSSETQEKIIEEMNQVRHNYLQELTLFGQSFSSCVKYKTNF